MSDCSKLCAWMVRTRAGSVGALDVGTTYVDLKDLKKPRLHREDPDGKITTREEYQVAIGWLEEEWRQFFRNELPDTQNGTTAAQPVAEALYDQFNFLPPWLPKPWNRMTPEERGEIQRIAAMVRERPKPSHFLFFWGLEGRDDRTLEQPSEKNGLLNVLKENRGNCMGLSHVFYFAQAVVLGREAQFRDVYWQPGDKPMDHVSVMTGRKVYDPAFQKYLGAGYRHYALTPVDEWALSLLHVADAQEVAGEPPAEVEETYRRAQELAPHHFRVQFELGKYLFFHGEWEEGLSFLRAADQTFPSDPELPGDLDFLERLGRGF